MLTIEERLEHPNYLLTKLQSELYRQVVEYMEKHNLTQTELAAKMNTSPANVSQLLSGNKNSRVGTMLSFALAIGQVIEFKFTPIAEYIAKQKEEKCSPKIHL